LFESSAQMPKTKQKTKQQQKPEAVTREQVAAGVKSVVGEELFKILVTICGYDAAPFAKQKAHA
jgi:hypothetical protein